MPRQCLSDPIPEVFEAAELLDEAAAAHLLGLSERAKELIIMSDMPAISAWTESLWGIGGPWSRPLFTDDKVPSIPKVDRLHRRDPTSSVRRALLARDGFHCRFCGIPVIRKEVRAELWAHYPEALRWGDKNVEQHAAFQAMWVQADHILPHSRGGSSDLDNLVVTCAPCNYGRSECTLAEVGLEDPRSREPISSSWDGLERVMPIMRHITR